MDKNTIDLQILDEIYGLTIAFILLPTIILNIETGISVENFYSLGEFVSGSIISIVSTTLLIFLILLSIYLREVISYLMAFDLTQHDSDLVESVSTDPNKYWFYLAFYYPIIIPLLFGILFSIVFFFSLPKQSFDMIFDNLLSSVLGLILWLNLRIWTPLIIPLFLNRMKSRYIGFIKRKD